MSQSLAVGQRLARKAAMLQMAAGVLVAPLAGLGWGMPQAAGVLAGAAAAALAGMLVKWLLVGVLLYLALAQWRLPPLAVLSGLALAVLVFPLAHLSGAYGQRNQTGDK